MCPIYVTLKHILQLKLAQNKFLKIPSPWCSDDLLFSRVAVEELQLGMSFSIDDQGCYFPEGKQSRGSEKDLWNLYICSLSRSEHRLEVELP